MLKTYKNSFILEKKFTKGIAREKFEFLREIKHFIFLRSIQNTPSSHRFSNYKSKKHCEYLTSMLIFPSISHTPVQVHVVEL